MLMILSGTTGTPKGVAVTNKNITSNLSVLAGIYPHDQSNRMLQACSQAFDVSVFEIFFAWANGMCLCAATNDILFEDFEYAVRVLAITHLSLTVTVASLLNPDSVPTVKFLVTSGEPMTDEVLGRWSQHLYQGKNIISQTLGFSQQLTVTKATALLRQLISALSVKFIKATHRHFSDGLWKIPPHSFWTQTLPIPSRLVV